jgi:hypothetical protein
MAVEADRQRLGAAFEMRIGLDLADAPGYWDLLSFLPPGECDALLRGAGYSPAQRDHLADTGTADPVLLEWVRTSHPVGADATQQAALMSCWDAAFMHDSAVRRASHAVQLRRSYFVHLRDALSQGRPTIATDPAIGGLDHLWHGYLRHGRRQLAALGDHVVLAPELASGYGIADLVAGHCLVEIKAVLEPADRIGAWLNQLLGYVLLDWFDTLRISTLGLYLGWQAVLVTDSLEDVLTASSRGPMPGLESLRADFRREVQADHDLMLQAQLRDRYPPLLAPPSPPDPTG